MTRQSYDTDLTDGQWLILEPLLAPAKPGGRPRSTDLRKAGGQPHPSAACIDSQSVKTAGAAQESGFNGGKYGQKAGLKLLKHALRSRC